MPHFRSHALGHLGQKQVGAKHHGPEGAYALPTTGAQATSLLGLTLSSLYLCQEASGNLADSVGAATLTVGNGPTFQRAMPAGRLGVYYDTITDKHVADVQAMGSSSLWFAAVVELVADPGAQAGIVGRLNVAGASDGADINVQTSTGFFNMLVRDAGAVSLSVTGTVNMRALGGLWLAQLQIDRAATTARARVSRFGGGMDSISGSIAAHGALDGALGMEFGFGCYGARSNGNAVGWGATAFGAQCEGASLLANNARAMGFE